MILFDIKSIYQGEEKKRIVSNFISLSVLQVVGYIFPLITMPYLAKTIGVKGFGAIAFAASVIAYFQTFTDWGFKYTAVRDIAQNRNNPEKISLIFSSVMTVKVFLSIISALFLYVLTLSFPVMKENTTVLWMTFLLIPGYVLFPDWLFQAMEEMKYITIMNCFSKLIFTALVFILIKNESDYVLEPLLAACGYMVSGVIAYIYAFRRFRLRFIVPSIKIVDSTIRSGWDMFLTQFFPTLYNNVSVIMLGALSGSVAMGLFSAGNKFITISDQFSQVLSRTFYPFLARRMDKHNVFVKITGAISITMAVILFCGADLIIKIFYTEEFSDAATVIRIMACSPFFLFLMNAFGTNGLVLIGKENILRNIIFWCSVFGLILSVISVYFFSYLGVASTLAIVWGVRGALTYIYAKNNNI